MVLSIIVQNPTDFNERILTFGYVYMCVVRFIYGGEPLVSICIRFRTTCFQDKAEGRFS